MYYRNLNHCSTVKIRSNIPWKITETNKKSRVKSCTLGNQSNQIGIVEIHSNKSRFTITCSLRKWRQPVSHWWKFTVTYCVACSGDYNNMCPTVGIHSSIIEIYSDILCTLGNDSKGQKWFSLSQTLKEMLFNCSFLYTAQMLWARKLHFEYVDWGLGPSPVLHLGSVGSKVATWWLKRQLFEITKWRENE